MKYKNFLFDLDGTLSDPQIGIITSMQYALSHFDIQEEYDNLLQYIGPPLSLTFASYLPEEKVEEAICKYRERFSTKGIYENELYAGIEDLLQEITTRDGKIFLATSKPEEYAIEIMKHFGLYQYFTDIAGSSMNNLHETKADVIHKVISRNNLQKVDCVMIGDREHDLIGAKQTGLDAVGVLYGFGNNEELKKENPIYIANTVQDLTKWVIEHMK